MKKIILIIFALVPYLTFSQVKPYEDFVTKCVKELPDDSMSDAIKEAIPEDFKFSTWLVRLQMDCNEVNGNKNAEPIPRIVEQEKVVDALLALANKCNSSKELVSIVPELQYIKNVYRKVETDVKVNESKEGGFSGLFADSEETSTELTLSQARKISYKTEKIRKKLSI